jgi:trimeric autotransporter adhesin
MKRSYIGLALGSLVTIAAVLSLPGCGHDQKLVSLSIQPQSFTFLTQAGSEQYRVTGTFIHPPATRDLTAQATWAVDDGVAHISSGLVSPDPLLGCGGGTVSATVPAGTGGSSNVVTAYATVTVDNPNDPLCPGGGKLATLNVGTQGTGTVTSLPGGISCPGTCTATFNVGSSVLLTANGNIQSWQNCPPGTGDTCSITIPSGGAAVVAVFQ